MSKIYPEFGVTQGPSNRHALTKTLTALKRSASITQNRNVLARFEVVELEEGMLVEYVENLDRPSQKVLCQIMLLLDGEPTTYNLRLCSKQNTIFKNQLEHQQTEQIRGNNVEQITIKAINEYIPLKKNQKIQFLFEHPDYKDLGKRWYNATIMQSTNDEVSGVLYEVEFFLQNNQPDYVQSVNYQHIRQKPRPKYTIDDVVEVRVDTEKGVKTPHFPAIILNVLTDTAIPGGEAYEIKYYPSGNMNTGTPEKLIIDAMKIRQRFEASGKQGKKKNYAEKYVQGNDEGWMRCIVNEVHSNGTYTVNVDDGEPESVPACASELRLYLAVGETAKRRSDGCPLTIVRQDDSKPDTFLVDVHVAGGEILREECVRQNITRVTRQELNDAGIEKEDSSQQLSTFDQRNEIIDSIDDIIQNKRNGPYVGSCHGIRTETGCSIHHKHNVFTAAYTLDGKFFVTGDTSGTVFLHDGNTGALLDPKFFVYTGKQNAWIVNLEFSSDQKLLAICILSGVIYLPVKEQDGTLVRAGPIQESPNVHNRGCLTCDFDSSYPSLLVSGDCDGKLFFWDVDTKAVRDIFEMNVVSCDAKLFVPPCINMVKFSPRGNHVAAATSDGNCYLYTVTKTVTQDGRISVSISTDNRVPLANGHDNEVTCVAYSNHSGNVLVTGGKDNVAVVWSAANGDMLSRLMGGHVRDITSVAFDPSNKFIVTASDDRRIIIWDAITAEMTGVLLGGHTASVNLLVFQPKPLTPEGASVSTVLVSVGSDERVLMWRCGGLRWQRIIKKDNHKGSKKRKDFKPIKALACHPTQDWVFFAESCDGRVMSTSMSFVHKNKPTKYLAKMDGSPVFCKYDPENRRCAAAAPKGWDPKTGDKKYNKSSRLQFSGFNRGKYKTGWFCNGSKLEGCKNKEKHDPSEMRFFCMECGYNICVDCSEVDGHSMALTSIDLSTDGSFAVTGAEDTLCILWDTSQLSPTPKGKDPFNVEPYYKDENNNPSVRASSFKYHKKAVTSVAVAPSGQHFVSSSEKEFMSLIWEVDRIKPAHTPLYMLEGAVGADFVDQRCVLTTSTHDLRLYTLEILVKSGVADTVAGGSQGKPVDFFQESVHRSKICLEKRIDKLGNITCLAVCSKIFKNFCAVGDSFGRVALLGLGSEGHRDIYYLDNCSWRDHKDQITCMAFNGTGHNLATGSRDMSIRVYSLLVIGSKEDINQNGVRELQAQICYMTPAGCNPFPKVNQLAELQMPNSVDVEFVGHMGSIESVAFSKTGSEIYSGDSAGHMIRWWWRADPHVDFSITCLDKDNTPDTVQMWLKILQNAFEFPRIGFKIDLALNNTVDIDTGVQLLTMFMSRGCFQANDRDHLFKELFYSGDSDEARHTMINSYLAGSIAGGTNSADYMKPVNGLEASLSPLQIIFDEEKIDSQGHNVRYGVQMLQYWLQMGKSSMYNDVDEQTAGLLVNFLNISFAVTKVLPTLANKKIEVAKDVLEQWAHDGLSLVTNPYVAYLLNPKGSRSFHKLYAHRGKSEEQVLDILPDSSDTPYGESLIALKSPGFDTGKIYKRALPTDKSTHRTEDFRFHVTPTVKAGHVPVVPCVFSLPFDRTKDISESLLHILADHEELFDVVFNESAETEFKSSPGISVLVDFKWRQYARREYLAQFFTYFVQYLCYCVFCHGLIYERQFFQGPPCNVFAEQSVVGGLGYNPGWNMTAVDCVSFGPTFAEMMNAETSSEESFINLIVYMVFGAITLFFSLYHLCMMIAQNRTQGCHNFWSSSFNKNYLDLATYIMMAVTVSVFLCRSVHSGAIGSVTSVIAGWKFLLSWRGFSNTSHYIRTIIEITRFSYIFLFIMIFFSIGCGWAFMLLFGNWQYIDRVGIEVEGPDAANQYELFSTFWRTIVTSWDFMVGNTDIESWLDSYYELIAIPLYFVFSFMVVLVMLNLVIALMADGYTGVMETKSKAKIMERANIIVGIEKTMNKDSFKNTENFPMWVHALMVENKGGTPIGDMPNGFEDTVTDELGSLKGMVQDLKEQVKQLQQQ